MNTYLSLDEGYRDTQILIVEDSTVERRRIEAILIKLGYKPLTAVDGANAAEVIVRTRNIDVVLCDWDLPVLSGLDLCKAIRNDPSIRQPYFIMLTGHSKPVDMVAAMDAGADDFIPKPSWIEEIRVRIQSGIRQRRLCNSLCREARCTK